MTNWQRLEQVVKWTGLSTNAFAMAIGLKRSENLYQIKRGSYGISKELARLITVKYPMISRSWLLTGDGQMMISGAVGGSVTQQEGAVPFFSMDASYLADVSDMGDLRPLYYISMPAFKGADFAAMCPGFSMAPDIPGGSIVIFKKVSADMLLPGEAYMVVTREFATIRYVRTIDGQPDSLLLVPCNEKDYDEMVVDKQKIEKLFLVKGIIICKQV